MTTRKTEPAHTVSVTDWLRLQRRFVIRTSEYVDGLGKIVSQGAFDPGQYIRRSAQLWSDVIGDVGDWLNPKSDPDLDPQQARIFRCQEDVKARSGSARANITLPAELFAEETDVVLLSTDGFIRTFSPESPGRPVLVLEPEKHVAFDPNPVKQVEARSVSLWVFDLADTILAGEVYEGLVWGTVNGRKVPVASVELKIV